MVEVLVNNKSGLFELSDNPLHNEIDFERDLNDQQLGANVRDRSSKFMGMYNPQWRVIQQIMDEIYDRSWISRYARRWVVDPVEDITFGAVQAIGMQLKGHGLEFEAAAVYGVINGFLGRTSKGMPATDFKVYRNEPGLLAKGLEAAGVKLPMRTLTNNEILTFALMEDAKGAIDKFAEVNESGANKFLAMVYRRGNELENILKTRYPNFDKNSDAYRVTINNAGHRIGLELQSAIDMDGIQQNGSIYYKGKMYNLTQSVGVEEFIEEALNQRFPLVSLDASGNPVKMDRRGRPINTEQPGNRIEGAVSEGPLVSQGRGHNSDGRR